jgi:hypothetical protein
MKENTGSWKVITNKKRMTVRVPATEQELLQRGQVAAELALEQSRLEEKKKAAMEEFKTDIDSKKSQLSGVLDEIRSQKIMVRDAECKEEFDVEAGKYRLWWGDRLVEERPMDVEEKQKLQNNIFTMAGKAQAAKDARAAAAGEGREDDAIDVEASSDVRDVIRAETNVKTKKGHC